MTVAAACSTTSRIPEGELLYTGTKAIAYPKDTPKSERIPADLSEAISEAVDVAPNNYIGLLHWRYPFPLGLWVYNNWPDSTTGLRRWLYDKLVAEPVLVSDVRPDARTHMIEQMLDDAGYFRGTASYELIPGRNRRKASIKYTINPGPAFPLDRIELPADTSDLSHLIDSLAMADPYLRPGSIYSTDSLSVARTRITNSLRNRGYYFFRPDYIEYLADSIATPGQVALRIVPATNIPKFAKQPYVTGRTTMTVRRNRGRQTPDTISFDRGLTLVQMQPSRFRRQIARECVAFRQGRTFSVRNMDRTQANLSRLGIFKSIDIEAYPDTTAAVPTLNVNVDCTLDQPLEVSVEVNASSKSNSYIGPGLTFGITNNNIFGGGEQFGVSLTGSYEWQTGHRNSGGVFNSYEAGITTSLAFPRLLAPKFIPRSRYQLNWTRIALNADILNRPHYFKLSQLNASITYDWRLRRYVSNSFTPLKLTYTKLMNTTVEFDSIMAANPAVALSFRSQFIPQMIYSYTYDRNVTRTDNLNLQFTVQEAGNVCWAIWRAFGVDGEKRLFGNPFSQFVKGQVQLVWNHTYPGDNHLVGRVACGAEHAYGNASQVPYAEQFYVGGANSVRAFTVRSIGPGSYKAPKGTPDDDFDRTGTFKFEANLEYRFPIAGALHGAVFLDAGNVWLLRHDDARPGGTLQGSTFLRDIATGTGAGLRLDISMLVIRADLGVGIHAPYNTGHGGYYNMESFGKSLAFHLAIGYPF